MKIKKETREKIAVIYAGVLSLGLTTLMAAAAMKGYKNSTVNLNNADTYEGLVTDTGIGLKRNTKMNVRVFYFRMNGLDDLLASYNMHQEYGKLTANIKTGDSIKIYFKESKSDDYNLDVIQIEKGGQIILDKSEFERKETALVYIGTVGGLLMFATFVWLIVRGRKVFYNGPSIQNDQRQIQG